MLEEAIHIQQAIIDDKIDQIIKKQTDLLQNQENKFNGKLNQMNQALNRQSEISQNQENEFNQQLNQIKDQMIQALNKQSQLLQNQENRFNQQLNQMNQALNKQSQLLQNQENKFNQQLNQIKNQMNQLKEEIKEKDKKIDTLKNIIYDIDSHCIDQIDNLDIFNDLDGKTQYFIISEKVKKQENISLQQLDHFLSYISNEQQKSTANINISNFITIEYKDQKPTLSHFDKNYIIKVKANVTEMLFLNPSINTIKLFETINHFSNFFFEIRYPSNKGIIGQLLNEKKKSLNFNLSVIISGIKETDKAFMNNSIISSIVIDKSVKKISSLSFAGCKSLTEVIISDSVINIDDFSFKDCVSLKKIVFPDSVREIGSGIFNGCESLENVILPPFVDIIRNDHSWMSCFDISYAYDKNYGIIKIDDYNLKNINKELSFFTTYIAKNKQNDKKVFIKNKKIEFSAILDVFKHIKISRLDIPGLLKIQGYSLNYRDYEESSIYILKEFLENGNVFECNKEYLESKGAKNQKINPTVRSKIIFGVAAIMKNLHDHNIILGNLSNWNVLLNDDLEPVIGSFSTSQYKMENPEDHIIYKQCISWFTPPEFILGDGIDLYSDVYSYGTFLYTMFSTKKDLYDNKYIGFSLAKKIVEGLRPPISNDIPRSYQNLIERCWNPNPEERPTFKEITSELKLFSYALEEFGMRTDKQQLNEYMKRIDCNI